MRHLFAILILCLPHLIFAASDHKCSVLLADNSQFNTKVYIEFREQLFELSMSEVEEEFLKLISDENPLFQYEKLLAIIDKISKNEFYKRIEPIFNSIKVFEKARRSNITYEFKGRFPWVKIKRVKNYDIDFGKRKIVLPKELPKDQVEIGRLVFELMKGLSKAAIIESTFPFKNRVQGGRVFNQDDYVQYQTRIFFEGYIDIFTIFNQLDLHFPKKGWFGTKRDRLDRDFLWDAFYSMLPSVSWLGYYRPEQNFDPRLNDYNAFQGSSYVFEFNLRRRFVERFSFKSKVDWLKRTAWALLIVRSLVAVFDDGFSFMQFDVDAYKKVSAFAEIFDQSGPVEHSDEQLNRSNILIIKIYEDQLAEIKENEDPTLPEVLARINELNQKIEAAKSRLK